MSGILTRKRLALTIATQCLHVFIAYFIIFVSIRLDEPKGALHWVDEMFPLSVLENY